MPLKLAIYFAVKADLVTISKAAYGVPVDSLNDMSNKYALDVINFRLSE